ncbi:hypothetical protein LYZ37_16880 [Vibrio tubiashii]|uniref:hypothetical protein n=1 Tax=Vibrio tubiashii TaxID=29498 RepID=UPI00234F610B|nr:hypothetical protein [Vibrio tubiashii]WCP69693.1 hypothetical protein LYZ37_16880 [Vibrio tubiashii]
MKTSAIVLNMLLPTFACNVSACLNGNNFDLSQGNNVRAHYGELSGYQSFREIALTEICDCTGDPTWMPVKRLQVDVTKSDNIIAFIWDDDCGCNPSDPTWMPSYHPFGFSVLGRPEHASLFDYSNKTQLEASMDFSQLRYGYHPFNSSFLKEENYQTYSAFEKRGE